MQKATERLVWAVKILAVKGDEQILEIGCGHGVAVSLVCEQLTNGTITAIDRSQKMIDAATKRNQDCVAAGKARFRRAMLEEADFAGERFDKLFAIRVNFFIQKPDVQLPKLKQLLKPEGSLYLFYDPPAATQTAPFIATATQSLETHGFVIKPVIEKELEAVQGVCIIARMA